MSRTKGMKSVRYSKRLYLKAVMLSSGFVLSLLSNLGPPTTKNALFSLLDVRTADNSNSIYFGLYGYTGRDGTSVGYNFPDAVQPTNKALTRLTGSFILHSITTGLAFSALVSLFFPYQHILCISIPGVRWGRSFKPFTLPLFHKSVAWDRLEFRTRARRVTPDNYLPLLAALTSTMAFFLDFGVVKTLMDQLRARGFHAKAGNAFYLIFGAFIVLVCAACLTSRASEVEHEVLPVANDKQLPDASTHTRTKPKMEEGRRGMEIKEKLMTPAPRKETRFKKKLFKKKLTAPEERL